MKVNDSLKLVFLYGLLFFSLLRCSYVKEKEAEVISLDKDWIIQPNGEWSNDGRLIKADVYSDKDTIHCDVPTTVLAALVKSGKINNPFFADNLEKVPREWFNTHWRFLKSFDIPKGLDKRFSRLCFDGINYSADMFLNGKKIASADTLRGAFRRFEIDVTGKLKSGRNNLEVRVFPPGNGDFSVGFVDWTPNPPDKNMGLFRGVRLRFNGPVSIEYPFVRTKIDSANIKEASISIECLVVNHSTSIVKSKIRVRIEGISIEREVVLKPLEKKLVVWSPQRYHELYIDDARLWWPVSMGRPELYELQLSCEVDQEMSDAISQTFGIREVSDYINKEGYRAYRINGRDIQIRGGGWADDLLLREDSDNLEAQVRYTKLMNLNCIRLEGFWGASDKLYKLCDKYGILLMAGWSCQWEHEAYLGKICDKFGGIETPDEMDLINMSLEDQVLWLRNHPSIFVWVLGSDKLPRPKLEKMYLKTLVVADPTRPTLSSCIMLKSEVTGSTAVKMNGPYDYVSPNYWYIDTLNGGAFGFNTETGPGPQIPPIESLRKMFPKNKLWPINDLWNYHSGRNNFNTIDNFVSALNKRYGEAHDVDEFVMKAQLACYEAIRPMFEAFAVNKANAGGVVQWMLNAPWPKLYWQLYDYYLTPTSAFFGVQNALKPLNIIYNYGDKNIFVSNDHDYSLDSLTAEIRVLDLNSNEVLRKRLRFGIAGYFSKKLIDLPALGNISATYFLDLRIESFEGRELAHSFYWLSTTDDKPDFGKSNWFITPLREFADFAALATMPKAEIKSEYYVKEDGDQTLIDVHISNPTNKVAFFIELKVRGHGSRKLILPAFWSDNYISLLPGEERHLTLTLNSKDLKGEDPSIDIKGFNVAETDSRSLSCN